MRSRGRASGRRRLLQKGADVVHLGIAPDEHESLCESLSGTITEIRESATCEDCISVYEKLMADLSKFDLHDARVPEAQGEALSPSAEIDAAVSEHIWSLIVADELFDLCCFIASLGVRIGAIADAAERQQAHEALARAMREGCGEIH